MKRLLLMLLLLTLSSGCFTSVAYNRHDGFSLSVKGIVPLPQGWKNKAEDMLGFNHKTEDTDAP